MKINRQERNRTFVVFLCFGIWGLGIVFTLVRHQVFHYNRYLERVKSQSKGIVTLHPRRGTIYDRNGDILAISVQSHSAFLSAKDLQRCMALFNRLQRVVPVSRQDAREIRRRIQRGDRFIWYQRKLNDADYQKLAALQKELDEPVLLDFVTEYRRVYPQQELAAHLLGGVGIDEQGLFGLEYGLDRMVRGRGGKVRVQRDARRRVYAVETIEEQIPGRDVTLTIDAPLQFVVQQELERGVRRFNGRSGAAIVLDARDGSILAMASFPEYRPDEAGKVPYRRVRNKALSFLYEPGSTFKVILAAAALENRIVTPSQEFDCGNGHFVFRNRRIEDVHAYDRLSFRDIVVHSSNVGAARVGLALGAERYYHAIRAFGFGRPVELSLPGNEAGLLKSTRDWSEVSPAFMAFGYEILVTPLQMARAFNVIAADGWMVEPRLLEKVEGVSLETPKKHRVISAYTARQIQTILREVVERGTGRKSRVPGLVVAGKTGTAKKVRNGEYTDSYVSTFGGFFPLPSPRYTLFVMVDEPRTLYYGGDVAAPLFQAICERMRIFERVFPMELAQG
ncbi:MAG: penicillin-binding protein 2 [Acidobacteriota bacterium]|jgi:cell division protein FtsI (penicillin-binding protein 3)|nr:penicillin-binding protein 2 [Acidobacteriota bacterium]